MTLNTIEYHGKLPDGLDAFKVSTFSLAKEENSYTVSVPLSPLSTEWLEGTAHLRAHWVNIKNLERF